MKPPFSYVFPMVFYSGDVSLPETTSPRTLILVATEHAVAPFRGQLRWLFHDRVGKGHFKGLAWLFVGGISLPYDEEGQSRCNQPTMTGDV